MKVKEFIKLLKQQNPEAEVLMSMDDEGNGYAQFNGGIDIGTVHPDEFSQYNFDSYYSDSHSDDDCCLEPGERKDFPKVICLWPH